MIYCDSHAWQWLRQIMPPKLLHLCKYVFFGVELYLILIIFFILVIYTYTARHVSMFLFSNQNGFDMVSYIEQSNYANLNLFLGIEIFHCKDQTKITNIEFVSSNEFSLAVFHDWNMVFIGKSIVSVWFHISIKFDNKIKDAYKKNCKYRSFR